VFTVEGIFKITCRHLLQFRRDEDNVFLPAIEKYVNVEV
jgi:hypothetical protein